MLKLKYKCLKARFSDNDIFLAFEIVNPSNMPSKRVGLNSFDITNFKLLLN